MPTAATTNDEPDRTLPDDGAADVVGWVPPDQAPEPGSSEPPADLVGWTPDPGLTNPQSPQEAREALTGPVTAQPAPKTSTTTSKTTT
jgi:hypothetical protein